MATGFGHRWIAHRRGHSRRRSAPAERL